MKKRWVVILAIVVCLSLALSFAVPALANRSATVENLLITHNRLGDATTCSVCGKPLTGAVGEQNAVAVALGLNVCNDCWWQIMYGNDYDTSILPVAQLGEDGKVLPSQLPAGQGGTVWGDITGLLVDQTDLKSALDAKISAITGTHLDNVFSQNGLLKRTGTGTYTIDTNSYLTGNQSISLSGDASGSGATSISVTNTGLKGVALPTLATGYLYYTGSAWNFQTPTGSSGGMTTLMKPSDQTINSGAGVYTDITGLTFPVVSGKGYAFYFYITFQSAATATGWKSGVNCPAGTLDFWASSEVIANGAAGVATHTERHNTVRDDMTLLTTTVTQGVDLSIEIRGRYLCTANGTFAARFANELASNTNIVVQAGSWGYYFESTAAK